MVGKVSWDGSSRCRDLHPSLGSVVSGFAAFPESKRYVAFPTQGAEEAYVCVYDGFPDREQRKPSSQEGMALKWGCGVQEAGAAGLLCGGRPSELDSSMDSHT